MGSIDLSSRERPTAVCVCSEQRAAAGSRSNLPLIPDNEANGLKRGSQTPATLPSQGDSFFCLLFGNHFPSDAYLDVIHVQLNEVQYIHLKSHQHHCNITHTLITYTSMNACVRWGVGGFDTNIFM